MRLIIKFNIVFLLLCAFTTATCTPLHQTPAVIIADTNIIKAAIPAIIKDTIITNSRDSANQDSLISKVSTISIIRDTSFNHIDTKLRAAALRLKQKSIIAREYLIKNGFNSDVCFMVDMSIPSGKNRFFVYNLDRDSVEFTALVSHGSGSYKPNCDDQLVFSNTPNSYATSIGKYKIGSSYYGTYGLSYKLYGLDSTNDKALERFIVLHADSYVPTKETYPYHIYESAGCPIVSPSFLTILGKYVTVSKKPMMLWIYN